MESIPPMLALISIHWLRKFWKYPQQLYSPVLNKFLLVEVVASGNFFQCFIHQFIRSSSSLRCSHKKLWAFCQNRSEENKIIFSLSLLCNFSSMALNNGIISSCSTVQTYKYKPLKKNSENTGHELLTKKEKKKI